MNFKKIGEVIDRNIFPIFQQISPTILTICGIWLVFWYPDAVKEFEGGGSKWYWWFKNWTIWLVLISAIVSVYTSLVAARKYKEKDDEIFSLNDKYEFLSKELNSQINESRELGKSLEDAEYTIDQNIRRNKQFIIDMASKYLMHIFVDHLNYSNEERISLYLHRDGEFHIIGRYSQNIDYKNFSRIRYPDNEGCLGEAWKTGNVTYKRFSQRRGAAYDVWQEKDCKVPHAVIDKIRMKSMVYMAIPINENAARVGVLLLESLISDKVVEAAVELSIEEHRTYLVEILKESQRVALIGEENEMEGANG